MRTGMPTNIRWQRDEPIAGSNPAAATASPVEFEMPSATASDNAFAEAPKTSARQSGDHTDAETASVVSAQRSSGLL
jgi:hypothetical protein